MRGEIGLIILNSAEKIGARVDQILSEWRGGKHFLIPAECPRFSSGEGKCLLKESVRDRYIAALIDTANRSETLNDLLKPAGRIRQMLDLYKAK